MGSVRGDGGGSRIPTAEGGWRTCTVGRPTFDECAHCSRHTARGSAPHAHAKLGARADRQARRPSAESAGDSEVRQRAHEAAGFRPRQPGRKTAHYTVAYKAIQQHLLPPGFPSTEVYAYGGQANFAEADQRADIHSTFSTPGPTFEAVRGQHIRVHFLNQLDGGHIFPVDPTIMFANPNNQPSPHPPFKPFPPGYRFAQNPIPVVTHLHGV
jgi:hypothetical protein